MLINHNLQLISVSVPKTGSTSIHHGLMGAIGEVFHTKNGVAAIYHMSASDIELIMGEDKFSSYFSFGVVRNPFDRMVSLYHDFHDKRGAIKSTTFDDFVLDEFKKKWISDIHFMPQEFFLCDQGGVMVSEVYKFEDGVADIFSRILERLQISSHSVGHARRSDRAEWRQYYSNPETINVVASHYKSDFDTFGYEI